MSEYVIIATVFTDAGYLVEALVDLGFPRDTIEVHDGPVTLYGYRRDARPERAEIVTRREYVGGGSNDIGFARQADGTFRAIISDYDQRSPGAPMVSAAQRTMGSNRGEASDRASSRVTQRHSLCSGRPSSGLTPSVMTSVRVSAR